MPNSLLLDDLGDKEEVISISKHEEVPVDEDLDDSVISSPGLEGFIACSYIPNTRN